MVKRKLEELNLLDNFLFGSMVTYPGIGEAFVRKLLKIIFQRDFGKLNVVPQSVYYGADTDLHGARLDVYIEETFGREDIWGETAIYDIEPEKNDKASLVQALPKRVRFYHAKIDARALKSGEQYYSLKRVLVLMIMPFDPFTMGRMVYTLRTMCEEVPDMPYDDGARTIFLYTKGTEGNPPEELRQLLRYMEDTRAINVTNEDLQEIHEMVKTVKNDGEVSLKLMHSYEREALIREEAMKEGIEVGMGAERENTEKERQRADAAEAKLKKLEAEILRLKKLK